MEEKEIFDKVNIRINIFDSKLTCERKFSKTALSGLSAENRRKFLKNVFNKMLNNMARIVESKIDEGEFDEYVSVE